MDHESLKGRLLVASPLMGDPNFERTVVFMLEHGEPGAVGLVLNRPSELEVAEPLPGWSRFAAHPAVVFVGGPVTPSGAICVARIAEDAVGVEGKAAEGWTQVVGQLGVFDLELDPDVAGGPIEELRLFGGYAGWGEGQLEGELAEHAWIVVDSEPTDPFTSDPEGLWKAVLRRQPGRERLLAWFPPRLSFN